MGPQGFGSHGSGSSTFGIAKHANHIKYIQKGQNRIERESKAFLIVAVLSCSMFVLLFIWHLKYLFI